MLCQNHSFSVSREHCLNPSTHSKCSFTNWLRIIIPSGSQQNWDCGGGKGPPPTPHSTGKTSQDFFQCPGFFFCWFPSLPALQGGQRGAIIITSGSLPLTPKMSHILKIKWPEGTFDSYKRKTIPFTEPINGLSWTHRAAVSKQDLTL